MREETGLGSDYTLSEVDKAVSVFVPFSCKEILLFVLVSHLCEVGWRSIVQVFAGVFFICAVVTRCH